MGADAKKRCQVDVEESMSNGREYIIGWKYELVQQLLGKNVHTCYCLFVISDTEDLPVWTK